MFLGGIVWGFVIATLLNVANASDASSFEFRQALEELNRFMSMHALPEKMRVELREFLHESRSATRQRAHLQLLSLFSPKLLQEVTAIPLMNPLSSP